MVMNDSLETHITVDSRWNYSNNIDWSKEMYVCATKLEVNYSEAPTKS